ncbi:MAG: hypothetical protein A2Z99_20055 [Treponema sp. GWB1_62_6]|nr:MAG: hypothetical protein A2Z99_20055 [Treponema sp. GWB1_62_6]OHE69132.1 MAG: hypothetical protein A2001_12895 [Treponema sp. GWC1_61_84]OHE75411.1 MAG: hypothetical protein A2413_15525 [Treponema sp. RIFOXYC1_FULL_61_9]HCM27068.1 phospholipid phosphatase [Treponema sp.]
MDNVLAWGLDFIRSVQTIGNPVLTTVMKAITFTGSEIAYLAAIPFIFWCYDERKGLRLATAFLLSAWVNCSLKEVWRQPRPYELDPSVGMAVENSFGLPSGHAQGSATFWGIIAGWMRSPYGIVFAIAMPLVVGFSRIYLGVHFPTDVVAGWLLGAGVLGLYYGFGSSMEALLAGANIRIRVLAVAAVAFLMNALYPQDASLGGVFFGMGTGYILMSERFPFSAATAADGGRPRLPVLASRYLIGLAGTGIIYIGLKAAFPGEESEWYSLFRFVRYSLLGAWTTAGAPWIFLRLRLCGGR